MNAPDRFRYRVTFTKGDALRFTGHLDLQRAWERLLRRARLPLYFSQGFNPRPKMQLAAALPLGFTGGCEKLDLWLTEPFEPADLLERLRASRPPGLEITAVEPVNLSEPALQRRVCALDYRIQLPPSASLAQIAPRIQALLDSPSLPRKRRGKVYDLRPLIESLHVSHDEGGAVFLMTRLHAGEGATGRPEELLDALGIEPTAAKVERLQIVLEPLAAASAP